jgi:hypothetical protein
MQSPFSFQTLHLFRSSLAVLSPARTPRVVAVRQTGILYRSLIIATNGPSTQKFDCDSIL